MGPIDYFSIFFTAYTPLIFVGFLSFIIKANSIVGLIMNLIVTIYSSHLFSEYFVLKICFTRNINYVSKVMEIMTSFQKKCGIVFISSLIYGIINYIIVTS